MAKKNPGVQGDILPPELLVRPTEVVEFGSPEVDVVEPNASGTLGNAVVPHNDLWRAGLDPYRQLGVANPAGTMDLLFRGSLTSSREPSALSRPLLQNLLSMPVVHRLSTMSPASTIRRSMWRGSPSTVEQRS